MKKSYYVSLAAILLTLIFLTIFGTAQQVLRLSANDPQIQMAEDAAAQLRKNQGVHTITSSRVDMAHSLAPFVIVYDQNGAPLSGNGYLNNRVPRIPAGVLKAADKKDYNTVTWRPGDGVRIASVSVKAGSYYVTSGRSLTEVERRESEIQAISLVAWSLSLIVLGSAYGYDTQRHKRNTFKKG